MSSLQMLVIEELIRVIKEMPLIKDTDNYKLATNYLSVLNAILVSTKHNT